MKVKISEVLKNGTKLVPEDLDMYLDMAESASVMGNTFWNDVCYVFQSGANVIIYDTVALVTYKYKSNYDVPVYFWFTENGYSSWLEPDGLLIDEVIEETDYNYHGIYVCKEIDEILFEDMFYWFEKWCDSQLKDVTYEDYQWPFMIIGLSEECNLVRQCYNNLNNFIASRSNPSKSAITGLIDIIWGSKTCGKKSVKLAKKLLEEIAE